MKELGKVLESIDMNIPQELKAELFKELEISKEIEASPIGAVLMGVYVLEYLGFSKYVDEILGEEHKTIKEMQQDNKNRKEGDKPLTISTGTVLSLLVADMIACPRHITRAYKIEEMAKIWKTGELIGIDANLLNDDRILRCMSKLGINQQGMQDVLLNMVMDVSQKAGIGLSKFILDTTLVELDGKFKNADKVCAGRGKNSFSQLVVSLVIASGIRIPVGFGVLPGNTRDDTTLPDVYETVNKVADEGSVEFLMDRIYMTAKNARYLEEHKDERKVYWVSPLKMGVSNEKVHKCIDEATEKGEWKECNYRSTKELSKRIEPPLKMFETTWKMEDKIKPELELGQKRRPKGSIKVVEIECRCVFYKHEEKAKNEHEKREKDRVELEEKLNKFCANLNKRKMREIKYCDSKLKELLNSYPTVKKFVTCQLDEIKVGNDNENSDNNDNSDKQQNSVIAMKREWNEEAYKKEEMYDGIFALLTNYEEDEVDGNKLIKKYRSRDEVEVDFKDMKGLLDLEKIIFQKQERIDVYIFLKIIAYFVLAFLRSYSEKSGLKITEKQIQESMGDMLLIENKLLPFQLNIYSLSRDGKLNKLFRELFDLPDPMELIKLLNKLEIEKINFCVNKWYQDRVKNELLVAKNSS